MHISHMIHIYDSISRFYNETIIKYDNETRQTIWIFNFSTFTLPLRICIQEGLKKILIFFSVNFF